jgi:DNA processing protein
MNYYTTLEQGDSGYPFLLTNYPKPPARLHCLGDVSLLNTPGVAVIGTRSPTDMGRRIAFRIAAYFASHGYAIISGLALGCDTEGHLGSLSVPNGKTIAILGTSLKNIYPKKNRMLAQRIVESGGLVLSAYDDDTYAPRRFVERDRLQAALSLAVIPVQARSFDLKKTDKPCGTRHACIAARELGRGLFVPVPMPEDEQRYPERYAGIRELMEWKCAMTFAGKIDYAGMLEWLAHYNLHKEGRNEPLEKK